MLSNSFFGECILSISPFFSNNMIKELFRGVAWYIDDQTTLKNFALSHRFAALAVKEISAYKKKQFTTYVRSISPLRDIKVFPILPNGFIHGDVSYSGGTIIRRYNTGDFICQFVEDIDTGFITKYYQAERWEYGKTYLTKRFKISEHYNNIHRAQCVTIEPLNNPLRRISSFYCSLCKWFHYFELHSCNFNTAISHFYYVFSDCNDNSKNVRLRYVTVGNQSVNFHRKVNSRLRIASKVVEYAKKIKNSGNYF